MQSSIHLREVVVLCVAAVFTEDGSFSDSHLLRDYAPA